MVSIILGKKCTKNRALLELFSKNSQPLLPPHGWIPLYGKISLVAVKGFISCTVPQWCEQWGAPWFKVLSGNQWIDLCHRWTRTQKYPQIKKLKGATWFLWLVKFSWRSLP